MGWTSTTARHYTENGKVDRKAECDALCTWEDERRANKVLKSSMRGSVYYAAVRTTDKNTGGSEVFAVVCLTSTKWDGGFNFGYKGITEDCGPCEDDCPKGILDLLTDTESKYAKEWRERCRAKLRDKKQSCQSLSSVKIGEVIEFEYNGRTIRAEKMAPDYQFKTPWFKVIGEFKYIAKTRIKGWKIVTDNAVRASIKPTHQTIWEPILGSQMANSCGDDSASYLSWLRQTENKKDRCVGAEFYLEMLRIAIILGDAKAESAVCSAVCALKEPEMDIRSGFSLSETYEIYNNTLNENPTPSETPRISTEAVETVNVSAEGENAEKMPVFSSREEVITYLDKTHGIEYDAGEVVYLKDGCCAEEHADGSEWCIYRNEDSDECVEAVRIAPQSPEAPQAAECTADTPKPRETARKPQNRGIGRATWHPGLGAGGYSMLDNASATLAAMSVPRECSTGDASYW